MDLITTLPQSYLDEFEAEILGRIPEEKVQVQLRQVENARIMQAVGSCKIEGLGQKMTEMDARLYFRLLHESGGGEGWLQEYLADNPELCAPGYRPKADPRRHGKTFVGGKPI